MEGSVYNIHWLLRANSYVFWNDKFTSNVLDNDEQDSKRPNKQRKGHSVCRQHIGGNRNKRGVWQDCRGNIKEIGREWLVYQAREVHVKSTKDWDSRNSNRTKWDRDGERESRWSTELARAKECKKY